MRSAPLLPGALLLSAAVLLAACGGGGSGALDAPPTSAKATLTGEVLSIDGDTTARDGVVLALVETGQVAETGADGWFTFGEVPAGTLTLDLVSAASFSAKAGTASTWAQGDGGPNDDAGHDNAGTDDNDLHGDGLSMERVREQERIHVRLRVQDGELGEMQCVRSENTERETERQMERTQANGDPDMEGEMEMEQDRDRERLRIRVEHADAGTDLEAVVISPDGTEESLGPRTVQANGECEWRVDTAEGGRLPHGAAAVEDLEGYEVQVRNRVTAQGMLHGELPGLPPRQGDADAAREQERTEERTQERERDASGEIDRDQDRERDGNTGDDA